LKHVGNAVVSLGYALNAIPYLAAFRDEIVIRIDDYSAV
jgi:hypothetical protein